MRKLLLLLSLTACAVDPVETRITSNPNVSVALLFEHEGCRVYRFYDNGASRYYAKCQGGTATVMHQVQSGENNTRPEEITTVNVVPPHQDEP